jgi:hypothetical protein
VSKRMEEREGERERGERVIEGKNQMESKERN